MTAPQWQPPMLASILRMPAEARQLRAGEWVFERKLDGLRGLAVRDHDRVELWSRNHLPFNRRFPDLVAALGSLAAPDFVMDGEVVALDQAGVTSFELLQAGAPGARTVYVAFDLLHLLGHDTTGLPLEERADLLRRTVAAGHPLVTTSEQLAGDPESLLAEACRQGWEGLVAKRRGTTYRPGRSTDWRKLKCSARQELVVGGWTDPAGSRTGFGALLVGYYDGDQLRYAGKVGTGFDERTLRSLHRTLLGLEAGEPPFSDLASMAGAHWTHPDLVAEVEFTEWTRDGRLRHPRFLGLRPDKPAREVRREL